MEKKNKLKKFFNSKVGSFILIIFDIILSGFGQLYTFSYTWHYDGHKCDFYYACIIFLILSTIEITICAVRDIVRFAKKYGKRQTESKD